MSLIVWIPVLGFMGYATWAFTEYEGRGARLWLMTVWALTSGYVLTHM